MWDLSVTAFWGHTWNSYLDVVRIHEAPFLDIDITESAPVPLQADSNTRSGGLWSLEDNQEPTVILKKGRFTLY